MTTSIRKFFIHSASLLIFTCVTSSAFAQADMGLVDEFQHLQQDVGTAINSSMAKAQEKYDAAQKLIDGAGVRAATEGTDFTVSEFEEALQALEELEKIEAQGDADVGEALLALKEGWNRIIEDPRNEATVNLIIANTAGNTPPIKYQDLANVRKANIQALRRKIELSITSLSVTVEGRETLDAMVPDIDGLVSGNKTTYTLKQLSDIYFADPDVKREMSAGIKALNMVMYIGPKDANGTPTPPIRTPNQIDDDRANNARALIRKVSESIMSKIVKFTTPDGKCYYVNRNVLARVLKRELDAMNISPLNAPTNEQFQAIVNLGKAFAPLDNILETYIPFIISRNERLTELREVKRLAFESIQLTLDDINPALNQLSFEAIETIDKQGYASMAHTGLLAFVGRRFGYSTITSEMATQVATFVQKVNVIQDDLLTIKNMNEFLPIQAKVDSVRAQLLDATTGMDAVIGNMNDLRQRLEERGQEFKETFAITAAALMAIPTGGSSFAVAVAFGGVTSSVSYVTWNVVDTKSKGEAYDWGKQFYKDSAYGALMGAAFPASEAAITASIARTRFAHYSGSTILGRVVKTGTTTSVMGMGIGIGKSMYKGKDPLTADGARIWTNELVKGMVAGVTMSMLHGLVSKAYVSLSKPITGPEIDVLAAAAGMSNKTALNVLWRRVTVRVKEGTAVMSPDLTAVMAKMNVRMRWNWYRDPTHIRRSEVVKTIGLALEKASQSDVQTLLTTVPVQQQMEALELLKASSHYASARGLTSFAKIYTNTPTPNSTRRILRNGLGSAADVFEYYLSRKQNLLPKSAFHFQKDLLTTTAPLDGVILVDDFFMGIVKSASAGDATAVNFIRNVFNSPKVTLIYPQGIERFNTGAHLRLNDPSFMNTFKNDVNTLATMDGNPVLNAPTVLVNSVKDSIKAVAIKSNVPESQITSKFSNGFITIKNPDMPKLTSVDSIVQGFDSMANVSEAIAKIEAQLQGTYPARQILHEVLENSFTYLSPRALAVYSKQMYARIKADANAAGVAENDIYFVIDGNDIWGAATPNPVLPGTRSFHLVAEHMRVANNLPYSKFVATIEEVPANAQRIYVIDDLNLSGSSFVATVKSMYSTMQRLGWQNTKKLIVTSHIDTDIAVTRLQDYITKNTQQGSVAILPASVRVQNIGESPWFKALPANEQQGVLAVLGRFGHGNSSTNIGMYYMAPDTNVQNFVPFWKSLMVNGVGAKSYGGAYTQKLSAPGGP